MSRLAPLLDRNRRFADSGAYRDVSIMPRHSVFVVTCLDPRVDPAAFLGIGLGDAMVVRNAGGRVTPEVLRDLAFISTLAEAQVPDGPLFEVAVVHHTQCGTGFLASEAFRRDFAERIGEDEEVLADWAVTEPSTTVRADVERILGAAAISRRATVSGHVYDVETGEVHTVVPSRALGQPSEGSHG